MSELIKDTDNLTIESLQDKNPRIITAQKDAALGGSMDKWGDLGGITYNMQTSRFITGHQRMRKLKQKYGNRVKIYIEQKYSQPDEFGTVGLGFVVVEGTNVRFAYREVLFSEGDEYAAGIAANNATGSNDTEMLAQIDYELSQLENGDELLALTGQLEDDVAKLLSSVGVEELVVEQDETSTAAQDDDGMQRFNVKFTDEQYAMVYQAIGLMKHARTLTNEPNPDLDANALYYICKYYVENATAQAVEPGDSSVLATA